MNIDCSRLFPGSKLTLLVWERFDDNTHTEALQLLRDIVIHQNLAPNVMPLLHPLGREKGEYERGPHELWCGHFTRSIGQLPNCTYPRDKRLAVSELWLQVTQAAEEQLWQLIEQWVGNRDDACAWRDIGQYPENHWQPLGKDLQGCETYYPRRMDKNSCWSQIPEDEVPWVMKAVWYRSTEIISQRQLSSPNVLLFDPCHDKQRIADLMEVILADLDLNEYGITKKSCVLDPSREPAAHLAAFATNGLTTTLRLSTGEILWQLEQFWNWTDATWPSQAPSRNEYLARVRNA